MRRCDWLAAEPFTLMLSAGFFGFFSHTGLLQALEERDITPRRIIGCSAGALAGGLWASGLGARAIAQELCALQRGDFWDPGLPLGGLLRGRKFARKLREVLEPSGVRDIEQCRVEYAAIVHDVLRREPQVFDRGSLELAIRASCTVPLMFRPIWAGGQLLVDGGVSDRIGRIALRATDERVFLHYLPSRRRRAEAVPTSAPTQEGMLLLTPDLPRVTPFRLHEGPRAYEHTLEHARRWLDEPATHASA